MQQLVQNLKNGDMQLLEVPFPALNAGHILVRNHYSVISAGTEGKTVRDARASYIGKARARKREVAQVLESIKSNGLATTYQRVMHKLEAPSALGYSCAGEVVAVAPGITKFKVGDYVACAGGSAVHAEVITAPVNLSVPVPGDVDLKHAAFTTLGAIAMQGVRRADPGLGANCVVIGLGLVGLLTVQLLEASGVHAIGVDIDTERLVLARRIGIGRILHRDDPALHQVVKDISHGEGTDAVIITAGTSSTDPIELAGQLCRKNGKVVIVGSVPTGFNRTNYYKKELELLMSCSYGPGRYDRRYEEKGIDYPIGQVRWSENRNMMAFVDLLAHKKLDIESLISHTFSLETSQQAYQMILDKSEAFTGIVLKYDTARRLSKRVALKYQYRPDERVNIGLIGAGSFAQNVLLPVVQGKGTMIGVASARPNNARYAAEKFGFDYCTGDAAEVLADDRINIVFITTRHDMHAQLVLQALDRGKHVFVEKPLCLTQQELAFIKKAYDNHSVQLMVGFNRRFSPHILKLRSSLHPEVPVAINYRINAGTLPPDHWVHDPEEGGGRIVGEVCHFVDLVQHLAGGRPTSLAAHALNDVGGLRDTLTLNMGFANGSTASIAYFSNGNKKLEKERLEIFSAGQVSIIDDFKTMSVYGKRFEKVRLRKQDKGHAEQIERFLGAIRTGISVPIPIEEVYQSMLTTFKIEESIKHQQMVSL